MSRGTGRERDMQEMCRSPTEGAEHALEESREVGPKATRDVAEAVPEACKVGRVGEAVVGDSVDLVGSVEGEDGKVTADDCTRTLAWRWRFEGRKADQVGTETQCARESPHRGRGSWPIWFRRDWYAIGQRLARKPWLQDLLRKSRVDDVGLEVLDQPLCEEVAGRDACGTSRGEHLPVGLGPLRRKDQMSAVPRTAQDGGTTHGVAAVKGHTVLVGDGEVEGRLHVIDLVRDEVKVEEPVLQRCNMSESALAECWTSRTP